MKLCNELVQPFAAYARQHGGMMSTILRRRFVAAFVCGPASAGHFRLVLHIRPPCSWQEAS
jgi:hypothetical protein